MSLVRKIKKRLAGSNGAVAVIVALLITALVGMTALVVDMGSLYEDRRSLQGVADAAALAGVQELPESQENAENAAHDSIKNNRPDDYSVVIDNCIIEFDSYGGVEKTKITVTVNNPDSPLYFGKIYTDSNSLNVGASATAIMGSPNPYGNHVVPWGLTKGDYVYGQPYLLKYGAPPEHSPGNFGALRIDPGGANPAYENAIINGCITPLKIYDWINVLTGNRVGPTEDGVTGRIALKPDGVMTDPSTLYDDDYELAIYDSQFIIIPIISDWPSGASQSVQILDFKPFIISKFVEAGGHSYVEGIFLSGASIVTEGQIGGLDDSGIRTIRLIK